MDTLPTGLGRRGTEASRPFSIRIFIENELLLNKGRRLRPLNVINRQNGKCYLKCPTFLYIFLLNHRDLDIHIVRNLSSPIDHQ